MTEPLAPVFTTAFLYAACKNVGEEAWPAYRDEQIARAETSVWPAIRTFAHELRFVCSAEAVWDASTYIDRSRCVMAGKFLATSHDVWLTCDDDVFAEREVLRNMVLACRETRGGIAVPYMNRNGRSMTFRRVEGPTEWLKTGKGAGRIPLRTVDRVGFGLVALHRELVERLANAPETKWFYENPPVSRLRCPQLFANSVDDDGAFIGEDFHFSRLCEAIGQPLRVLLNAPCEHAGILAMLDDEGTIQVSDPEHAARLDQALREGERALAGQPLESQGA